MKLFVIKGAYLPRDRSISCFFFNDTATTEIYTLSLHDALPILTELVQAMADQPSADQVFLAGAAEHQAELIRTNATEPARAGSNLLWATTIGNFDGIVMNAHGLDLAEDFDRSNQQHQI